MVVAFYAPTNEIMIYSYDDKMVLQTCWISDTTMNHWTEPFPTTIYTTLQAIRNQFPRYDNIEILEDTGDL